MFGMLQMILAIFVCVLLQMNWQSAEAQTAPSVPALEDFLGPVDISSPELSPKGDFLASLRRSDGADFIVLTNLDAVDASPAPINADDFYVEWLEWANDDTLLVATTGWYDLRTGRLLTRKDIEEETPFFKRAVPLPSRRLVSINRDTRAIAVMFDDNGQTNRNFNLGTVTDFLPNDPDHILMPAKVGGALDLFKVNVRDGSVAPIADGSRSTSAWFADRNGKPAFRLDINRRGTEATIYVCEDGKDGKLIWRKSRTIRFDDADREVSATVFRLLNPGPTTATYYVLARPSGADRTGVYLYDFAQDKIGEKLHEHPEYDIAGVITNSDSQKLLGTYHVEDRIVVEMEGQSIALHLATLAEYFGPDRNVLPIDSSADETRWLLLTSGPTDPGSYHVYFTATGSVVPIGMKKLSFTGKVFAPSQRVDYIARDGTPLHGYLTRPAGAAPATPLPLIVMPHGGPEARTSFGFNRKVQFLASLGYQVFEPNFRGSAGFGKAFADKGRKQWGKAMQTDVDDAYAHLISSGLAQEGQACIAGYSYGGYAALAAAALTPEQYACVIAGAAPSDLVKMLNWERQEEGRDSDSYLYWVEHIGDPSADKESLEAVSPARMAERVIRPVLLIHGEKDRVVPVEQSEMMAEALKKARKPYEFIRLAGSRHRDRTDADEKTEFEAIRKFLAAHLPAKPTS